MAESCDSIQNLTNHVNNINVFSESNSEKSVEKNFAPEDNNINYKWGFPLNDLYKLGLKFYKDKEGKAINLTYQNKLKLVAYSQQISQGPFNLKTAPPLGVLDVIGKDRREAWQALGNMTKEEAMISFIDLLDEICPLFKPFIEAQKADLEEKVKFEEQRKQQEILLEIKKQEMIKAEEERESAEERKRQIQDALNAHTFQPFKAYAEEQYPGNPEQQAVLVRQLQEQHYHQYMQQLMQQQQQQPQLPQLPLQNQAVQTVNNKETETESDNIRGVKNIDAGEESDDEIPKISPPLMWTRKDIKDFKESIRKEGGDAIIKVGHGETVTVRVPTHKDGTCLFWEFATDSYDIGFGVYFEWTKSPTTQVSVHIQDSEDEDDDLEDDDDLDDDEETNLSKIIRRCNLGIRKSKIDQFETQSHWVLADASIPYLVNRTSYIISDFSEYAGNEDIEKGSKLNKLNDGKEKPLLSAIVPIYRRDCQDEVYAGSHAYPGEGIYLLKFDNSYSLWRSKTLYYRVYYTR